jgi:hypothetical protein
VTINVVHGDKSHIYIIFHLLEPHTHTHTHTQTHKTVMMAGIIETMSNREDKLESALDSIEDCKIGLNNVERNIEILEKHSIEDLREQLSDVEHAKLNVGLAYCLASLMYVSLRSKGRDISTHPVKDDIARIREYVSKLNEVGKSHSAPTKARTTSVDAAAAKRVVSHQIAPNKKQRKK